MASPMQHRWLLVIGLSVAALAGCGGGGGGSDSGAPSDSGFVNYTDSANGDVVVDADSEQFRVSASSRQVVDRSGVELKGLFVDTSGKVLDGSAMVGTVGLGTSVSGSKIAVFQCSDGSAMNITNAVSGWSYKCGTASGDGSATSYLKITGNANGDVILDVDNEPFRVAASNRAVVDRSSVQLSDLTFDTEGKLISGGKAIGAAVLSASGTGSKIAVFVCSDGSSVDLTVAVNSWSYKCGSASGSGGGAGGSGAGVDYVTFNGNSNGVVILDAQNEEFRVNAANRQVVDRSGKQLINLFVDSSGNIQRGASKIGAVVSGAATNGARIAVMQCSDGTGLDLTVAASGWSYQCGNGASNTGSDVSGTGTVVRNFTTWNGSVNGIDVLDAGDEKFRFYSDNGCIYSVNQGKEYTNFCVGGGNSVNFAGTSYAVTRVLANDNRSCIAALVTSDGYLADLYTSGASVEYITKSTKRPANC